ncbi:hypothetical protein ASC77_08845 [Nocardioides sp. Root1257]|nr:hypothetical protein ASC77_08845 [Nocardioides sp. Root1257]KRC48632.1 hypothetical protein ASE24_08850 [Nocardioides sp. Root224]
MSVSKPHHPLRPSRFRRSRTGSVLVCLVMVLSGLAAVTAVETAAAADPCGTGGNKIACENSKPGSPPSVWDVDGAGDDSIQGFATDISVNVGSRIDFKIDTSASAYSITIFRMGWYGGDGAREITTVNPSASLPQHQPQCITDATTELYDCGTWGVSASWNVPSTAVSGVYIALLKRNDNGDASHITFVVRDDASTSNVVFQTSDPTWQAYNTYGGSDFYQGAANGRAYKISYNRPVLTRDGIGGRDFFFSNEYPAVRFLERNGYDVSYMAGVDTDRRGALIKNHKVFLSVGHDEYWSGAQRANVEAARDAGVNLQFLSGNEIYWRTRYEASADSSHTAYRTLVSYKETWAQDKIDPSSEWTGTWRDPRFAPKSAGGGLQENALSGTIFMSNVTDLPVTVSKAEGKLRLWRNTGLSSMVANTTALAPHTVGYESDEDQDNGSRPPGLIDMSTVSGAIAGQYMQDYGSLVGDGTTTHHITLYKAPSGALVFGAGSVQWTWGLDEEHDSPFAAEPADQRMQQAQVNLLADMGAQPTTLMSTLSAATKSTDTAAPTVAISTPAAGAATANGTQVTVTGTAADTGGGVVAGVEYSTDAGSSWHPATGTTAWSFTFVQHGIGDNAFRVRAVDDSANIGTAVSRSLAVSCPCSIYGSAPPPTKILTNAGVATQAANDSSAAELGVRFTPTTSGFITGVRFFKGTGNTGTHVGSLWSSAGQQLGTATFANESATGWQTVSFNAAVPVTAGQTYVVSYTAPNGHYANQPDAFSAQGIDASPFQVAGGYGAVPAGVYGNAGAFPDQSYKNSSYFVDVVFSTTDTTPPAVVDRWPLAGSSSVAPSTTVRATFSKPMTAGTVSLVLKDSNGTTVAGSTAYDAGTRTVTFTPTAALSGFVQYTATVSGTDTTGLVLSAGKTWSFTTARPAGVPGVCPCSLFDESTTPTVLEVNDPDAVTLGVRFTSDVAGSVTGVRFYKGPNNTGSHTGTLWSASGTKLAEGTFSGESTSGWQTLTFTSPVAITKNTEYVASYRTTVGRYSATPNAFAAADLSKAPLRVTSTAGAYTYGTGFPSTSASTSYLVDVVFQKGAPTISVTSQAPAPNAVDVPRGTTIGIQVSDPLASGYAVAVTQQPSGQAIAGTTVLDPSATQLTFTPSATLPADSDIRVQVSGLKSQEGATLATQTWTFHTRGPDSVTSQSLFTGQVPQVTAVDESSPVELGTAFSPTRNGTVTGIRFYKGPGNNGTHTGSLWSSSGTRLATVTFANETANGWQQAALSSPVTLTAGTTYVVSYYAPQGHYSYTPGFFSSALTSGDLTAPADSNGRYLYGAGGGFPTFSYNASSYFVDVVFEPATPTISVTGRLPASGATNVPRGVAPSITFDEPVATGYTMTAKQGVTTIPGTVALSDDQKTLTFTPSASLPADADVTVTVSGVVSTRGAVLPTQTWTFHTEPPTTVLTSLFDGQTPATTSVNDGDPVELGTSFTPSVNGQVTQVRFYKGAGNTGVHTGSIWSSTGTRLATVTFTGESASGWQTATFASPVSLTGGQTYVVSYYAPNGHYSATGAFFGSGWTSGVLTAPATNNGRYLYGSGGGFPNSSWNATNYFVDVVFRS